MQKRILTAFALTVALAAGLFSAARAQTPTTPAAPPAAHHGLFGHLFHRPAHPALAPGMRPGAAPGRPTGTAVLGRIVGNKRTHVYHLPGDKGALPSAANSVYFSTESRAVAAGYHRAGTSHGKPAPKTHKMRGTMVPVGAVPR